MTAAGFTMAEAPACGACGAVYDPAAGDPARGVPAGTPFAGLPDSWRCPGCGGPQHGFAEAGGPGADAMTARVAALVAAYRVVAARDMADVPICNPALSVEAVGFHPCGPGWMGVIVAPWLLNAVLIPRDPAAWQDARDGDRSEVALPGGRFAFTASRVGALGVLKALPVVSAMNLFENQDAARAAAELALSTLTTPPPAAAPAAPPPPARVARPAPPSQRQALSRRALLGRGGR